MLPLLISTGARLSYVQATTHTYDLTEGRYTEVSETPSDSSIININRENATATRLTGLKIASPEAAITFITGLSPDKYEYNTTIEDSSIGNLILTGDEPYTEKHININRSNMNTIEFTNNMTVILGGNVNVSEISGAEGSANTIMQNSGTVGYASNITTLVNFGTIDGMSDVSNVYNRETGTIQKKTPDKIEMTSLINKGTIKLSNTAVMDLRSDLHHVNGMKNEGTITASDESYMTLSGDTKLVNSGVITEQNRTGEMSVLNIAPFNKGSVWRSKKIVR